MSAVLMPHRGHGLVRGSALALVGLVAVAATAVAPAATAAPQNRSASVEARNRPCITAGEWQRLRLHMPLSRVAAIVGTKGLLVDGDPGGPVRQYVSCAAVQGEYMELCMMYRPHRKLDGTGRRYLLIDKDHPCPPRGRSGA